MSSTTLQQLDRGIAVCPFAKDRAISARVMKSITEHAHEDAAAEPSPLLPVPNHRPAGLLSKWEAQFQQALLDTRP